MKLLEYQNIAVENVLYIINYTNQRTIKLQAPTGSGKTFITANIVKRINQSIWALKHPKRTFLYIAPSTGSLDYQGYKKITSYIDNGYLSGYRTHYINQTLNIDFLKENTIHFIGWGMIRKGSSILRQDSETKTLYDIIDDTKSKGIEIILIVDEAHREYNVKKGIDFKVRHDFVENLDYIKVIEMSATLDGKVDVRVNSSDVKASGIIKQSVIVNHNSDLIEKEKIKQLIQSGIDKINDIKKSILKTKMPKLNPLLLIQIPDGNPKFNSTDINTFYLKIIKEMFYKNDWKEGFDFAIWLDKKKTTKNKEDITANESQYKAVIFKQALATGWDVPRAQVLVKLRNPKKGSKSFEIQTIGRILRNPFLKIFKVYSPITKNDVNNLNNAFVYTNDSDWINNGIKNDYDGTLEIDQTSYDISERAIKNPIKINTVKVKLKSNNNINLYDELIQNKKNVEFFNALHKIIPNIQNDIVIMPKQIQDSTKILDNKVDDENYNQKLGFSNDSLFYIYLNLLNTISNNRDLLEIINMFAVQYNITKKKVYKFIISHFKKSISIGDNGDNQTYINVQFNKMISDFYTKNITYGKGEEFNLNDKIQYKNNGVNYNPDGLGNSYKLYFDTPNDLNKTVFDSWIEMEFYKKIQAKIERFEKIHIFRNKTNPVNSYYSEYYSIFENKISSFFPDFIISTLKSVLIIECKGLAQNDIDKNTKLKMSSLYKNVNIIENNKKVFIIKVGKQDKNDDLSYQLFKKNGHIVDLTWNELTQLIFNPKDVIDWYDKKIN